MSARQWNEEQLKAIEDKGGSLLVSAAAGSGKTAVLVEKAVRLITQSQPLVPADRLLILTFTNAAAWELRGRIAARLEEEIALGGKRESTNCAQFIPTYVRSAHNSSGETSFAFSSATKTPDEDKTTNSSGAYMQLMRQRMLLGRAFIGTVDAFCQQLVRENFAKLDIPPDITVGEEAMLLLLSAKALADTMETMIEDEDFAAFSTLYGRARSDKSAEDAVLALYEYTDSLPNAQQQLIQYSTMYEDETPPEATVWGRVLLARAATALKEAHAVAQQLAKTAKDEQVLAGCENVLIYDVTMLKAALEAAEANQWDALYGVITGHQFLPFRPKRAKDEWQQEVLAEARAQRDLVKYIVEEISKYALVCTSQEYEADREVSRKYVGALCRAVQMYRDSYMAAKLAEHVLDFSDFERLALELLQNENGEHTQLAVRLAEKYEIVMVDEYQDTNELQSAIYEAIGGDVTNSVLDYPRPSLFYVGDVKQSIYRFRHASPGLFLHKKHIWAPHETGKHPAHITLARNYRSTGGLINAINYLFQRLMSPALGEVDYQGEERLAAGGTCPDEGQIEMRIIREHDESSEAEWVARRIYDMIKAETPVWEGGRQRPCGYGDFCILMRASAKMPVFLDAFEKKGIAAAAVAGDDILSTPEVIALTAVLAAIDNPGDDIQLVATMLGPLFRFTANEVTALRAQAGGGRLWGALVASENEKAAAFVKRMTQLRALAGTMPVGHLCELLVNETGYLAAVGAMQGGAGRKENLHRFIAWAARVGAGGRGGLAAFVRLCANGRGPAGSAASTVPNHVNMLTIHKSKGLEYPFVFLCDAKHRFNLRDLAEKVQLHAKLGVGVALRNNNVLYRTLQAAAIRAQNEAETLSEEMRLLYVALTRAKQRAIITFAVEEPEKLITKKAIHRATGSVHSELFIPTEGGHPHAVCPGAFLLARENSMADWLLCALMSNAAADKLLDACGLPFAKKMNNPVCTPLFELSIEDAPSGEEVEAKTFELTAQPDNELLAALKAAVEKKPQRLQLANVPAKVSVSSIAKRADQMVYKRPSFMYAAGLSAAEKGTAQHAFMQFADLFAASKDTEAEIKRLVSGGFISREAGDAVNRQGVRKFFASALWARIGRAKKVLREYDFITAIKAAQLHPEISGEYDNEEILVQGIADLVLVGETEVEVVDYKTDRVEDAEELVKRYAPQLWLYASAVEKRLGLPVQRLTVWSFALGQEVEVSL